MRAGVSERTPRSGLDPLADGGMPGLSPEERLLVALYILVEDEFRDPVYGDPDPEELDEGLWERVCELIVEALEDDGDLVGTEDLGENRIGWRTLPRSGLSFVCIVTDDVAKGDVATFLKELSQRYLDEVDDIRSPERAGVADVVIDVIPPWED